MTQKEPVTRKQLETGGLADSLPRARLDSEGRVNLATEGYEQLNGGPPDESSPLGLRLLHPDDVEVCRALVEEVAQTPEATRSRSCRIGDESTGVRKLVVTLSNHLDDPAIQGVLVNLREVPSADTVIRMMLDSAGRILSADPGTRRFLGATPPFTEQVRLSELIHADDQAAVRREWDQLLSDAGSSTSVEFRVRRWDAEWRWIEAELENRLGIPGVGAVVATGRDVTGRRVDAWRRFDRDEWLDNALEAMPWKLMIFDQNCGLSYASPGLPARLGMREGSREVSTKEIEPDFQRELIKTVGRLSAEPGSTARSEFRHTDAAGDAHWLQVLWVNRSDDPVVGGIVAIFVDVTEGRELESRYLQVKKLETIGQLAGGLTHDFNNVLGVILAGLDFIEDDSSLTPSTVDEITILRTAANRAASLARQLLGVSRPRPPMPEQLDVAEVAHSMLEMVRPMLGESITVDSAGAAGQHFVRIDRGHLEQVILNLCVNARDAMPEGGRISIGVGRDLDGRNSRPTGVEKPFVRLEVRDSGVGMSPSILNRVMEAYFTTKSGSSGSGLGLFMVERIVSQTGGRVEITSEPGAGTCVRLLLPATDARAHQSPAVPEKTYEGRGSFGRVLVVEDELALLRIQRLMLKRAGYEVLSAASVAAALDVATSHEGPIDLLMTDLVLPDGDGTELAQQLLASRPTMKVLFSTGYAPKHTGLDAFHAGVPILNKPYTENELLGRVRDVLVGAA